jgi:ketosteroid isomerase-like protein
MSERVTNWIDGYRKAWLSNDEADIRALFTDDAVYESRPYDPKARRGADAIVAGWLESADGPDDTTWEWHPVAEEGDIATIQGRTVYSTPKEQAVYDNLWVITFAPDGRASHFTEWYMERKAV